MPFCRLSRAAFRDLDDIAAYISADNPRAASQLIARFEELFQSLALAPGIGRLRPELGPNLRSFAEGRYLIVYRPLEGGIAVARVLHGARDLGKLSYPVQ